MRIFVGEPAYFKNILIDIISNLLISFRPNSNQILWEATKKLVITWLLINEDLSFIFGCCSMGFCGIGYYITLGNMTLGNMTWNSFSDSLAPISIWLKRTAVEKIYTYFRSCCAIISIFLSR